MHGIELENGRWKMICRVIDMGLDHGSHSNSVLHTIDIAIYCIIIIHLLEIYNVINL